MPRRKVPVTVKVPPLERLCWVTLPLSTFDGKKPTNPNPNFSTLDECCLREHRPGRLTCAYHAKHEDAAQIHREKHRHVKAYHATT